MRRKYHHFNILILVSAIVLIFASCKKDDDDNDNQNPGTDYSKGSLITNEGLFGSSNGSVSYYDYSKNTITNGLFETVNARPLGDVVQSATNFGGKTYLVVNGSNKIEVVTTADFKESAVITGLTSPRYFLGISSTKAYVTQWGENGVVKVIDLVGNSVIKTINVSTGPEKMAIVNGFVYVVNGGGWGTDSIVSVINTTTDELVTNITVDVSPMDIVADTDNNLWVMCKGSVTYDSLWNPIDHQPAVLVKINSATNSVAASVIVSENTHPEQVEISPDGSTLYYGGGMSGFQGIYEIDKNSLVVPTTPLIDKTFYGFAVRSVDGVIYGLDAGNYQTNGTLYRYSPAGTQLGSYETGLIPNGATF